jgi:PhzF family phenazine biosynthesis protein
MANRIFVVDAFADELFNGNPAAVCPLDAWPDDAVMQAVAAENNLSETAFCVREDAHWRLRWFTPTVEVDLCGHATLATAHVLMRELDAVEGDALVFETRSGRLRVRREGDLLVLDFPAFAAEACDPEPGLIEAMGARPREVLGAWAYVLIYEDANQVRSLDPDTSRLMSLGRDGVLATAPGEPGSGVDFVSRCFFPGAGIPEDPVTGSAHCVLAPLWGKRLAKDTLFARQLSARGGSMTCRLMGERVELVGDCVRYLRGEIELPRPG